jgi:hypothetical protein
MRRFFIAALLAALSGVAAQAQPALSNDDLLKLSKSGLSEDFILNLIDQQGSRLSTDVSSLIDLRQNGVNERILGAAVRKSPPQESLNSDSILRLAQARFSDNFILDLMERQPGKFTASASRIVELKQAGVSERILSKMVREAGAPREIPSGTQVSVRLIEGIDSEKHDPGAEFRASVDEDILVGGEVVVPRGADAKVRLAAEKDSGKLTGRTVLTVELISVSVNGRPVRVNSSDVIETSKSQTNSTLKRGAVVGAVGAVIGAIAGGGKGAAIGAGAGAAAGAGSEVFTKGQRVKIPSETLLTFTLQDAARL